MGRASNKPASVQDQQTVAAALQSTAGLENPKTDNVANEGDGPEHIADASKPKATKPEVAALEARIEKLEAQIAALLANPEKTSICPEFAQSLA